MLEVEKTLPVIRQALMDDLPEIARLTTAVVADLRRQGIDQWDELYPTSAHFQEDIQAGTLFVCERETQLLGTCCVNTIELPGYETARWHSNSFLVVHRLLTEPLTQKQGLGRQLMQHAEQIAKQTGYRSLRLDCFTKNPRAIQFYERLGYQLRGKTEFRKGEFLLYEKLLTTK